MKQLVTLPDIISLDPTRQKPILELVAAAHPHLFLVNTTDLNGFNIARNDDQKNRDYSDRLWYQGAVSGKPVQFQSLVSRTTGNPALNMAAPIRNAAGDIIGVGSIVSELADITKEVNAQKIGESGFAYIVDEMNTVVAHPDPAYAAELRDLSTTFPVQALRAGTQGIINYTDENGQRWIAYIEKTDHDWGVIVQQLETEVLGQSRNFWQFTLILIVTIAILLSVATWLMTRRITAPIAVLTDAAAAISSGNLEQRVRVESADEIGVLGQAFNQMAEQVGGLLQTVQTRGVELEERTKELEASQRVTFAASEHATPDELLDLVVNLIRDQFDLYHAQVYMVDEAQQAAVLRQSTGYAGRQLLQRKHHIALDTTALVTRAIHTGEAILVDDVKADPNFLPNPLLPDTHSELVVPLKREGKVIGVLDAQDRTPGRFNPSTTALFQTMADQVTILFENSELLQRITDQTEVMGIFTNQLRTAADIARRLGTILDPEQLLQEVVELIQSRFGLYHAHVYLLDENTNVLKLATGSGEVGRVLRERGHSILLNAEKSLVARAARSRGTILVTDTTLESDFMPNPLLPQTRSELSIPLVAGNTVLGVLDLQDDQAGRFTEVERDTFGTLAGQIATSLQNAEHFEQQRRAEALARANEIQFRVLFDNAQDAIFTMSGGKFADCNAKTLEIFGTTRDQILNQSPARFSPETQPDGRNSREASQEKIMAALDGTLQFFEWQHIRYDGVPFDAEVALNRVEYGGQTFVQATVRDITERKQAEAEIQKRASELQTVAEVGTAAATILEPDRLLAQVVELTKSNFGLYHTHIYLIDELGESLVLAAGAGEAGAQMKAQGWKIAADSATSLVARAFRTREGVIANDVRAVPDFLPNPLLPDTRSELAVPLIVGAQVLGVLDVQSDQVGRFTREDVAIQTTLAGQVASSLQNAQLFEAQQRAEALIRRRAEFDRLVAEVSAAFVNASGSQIDAEIDRTLEQISRFADADRSYVFIFSDDKAHMTNTHEWCAPGIAAQIQDLQDMPVTTLPWFTEHITRMDQIIYLPRVADLPDEASAEKQIFAEGEIKSLLAVPMVFGGSVVGFMGFDSVRGEREWSAEEINALKMVGQTIISAFQRRRAETAILQERDFSAAVINSLPGIFYVVDAQANLIRWNDRYIVVTGYTPEELTVIGALGPIAEEDRATVAERIQKVFLEGEAEVEAHLAAKSGERIPYYLTGKRAEIEGKTYVVGMGIDITDRVAAEAAVRESRRMLEIVMNSLPESIFWKDKDLVYLGCNTNFAHDAGFASQEQVIGKTDHDMPWKDQVALYQADDRHVIDTGESKIDYEEPQSTPDGGLIWLRTSKLPLYNEQGEAYAVLGAYADITEMKKAQAEIQKRASELQTVAEVGTAAATILDPDRLLAQVVELTKTNFGLYHAHIYLIDETGEFLVLASGAGEAGAQMKAQGWKIAADSATSLVARAFRTREGVIVNDVQAAPDFLPNPLLPETRAELAVPLIVGERVLGVLDVQADQVGRFTREDVAIQTTLAGQIATAIENARLFQESRQVDRLKSEFLANMSHELRTPLNSIIGYIQLLLMDLEGEVSEESYEDMRSIDTNSKHLLNLINDILDLAKIEAGRVELHLEQMDVAALLDTVKNNNAGLFINSALSFNVSAEEGLPPINADPVRINQILNNLISNAFKFTESGGVTLRAYQDNNDVCIAVQDTGIGIAEKDLEAVFERFRQVDGSFTRRAEGTGLGLSITRLLVEMHKGRLSVRSKPGEGSAFTVHLPTFA